MFRDKSYANLNKGNTIDNIYLNFISYVIFILFVMFRNNIFNQTNQ